MRIWRTSSPPNPDTWWRSADNHLMLCFQIQDDRSTSKVQLVLDSSARFLKQVKSPSTNRSKPLGERTPVAAAFTFHLKWRDLKKKISKPTSLLIHDGIKPKKCRIRVMFLWKLVLNHYGRWNVLNALWLRFLCWYLFKAIFPIQPLHVWCIISQAWCFIRGWNQNKWIWCWEYFHGITGTGTLSGRLQSCVFAPQTWEKVVFFMDFDFIHP